MAITSYEVGAVFRIGDQASAPLLKISEGLARLQKQIVGVKEAFAALSGANIAGVNRGLLTLDRRLVVTGETAAKTGAAITAGFARADTSIAATAATVARLNVELAAARRGTAAATTLPAGRGTTSSFANLTRGLDRVESRLARVGPASTSAADAIVSSFGRADAAISSTRLAVALLANEFRATGAASALVRGPRPGPGGAGGAGGPTPPAPGGGGGGAGGGSGGHRGNNNWQHVGIGLGMGGFIGVHEITHGLRSILDAGGEYQHVLTGIQKQNATKEEIAAAVAASRKLSQTIAGVTETEALEAYGTNRGIFGHKDAMAMMKPLLEFTQVIGGTTGDYAGAAKKVYDMTRAADLMGKLVNPETHEVDTEKFKNFLELGSKVTLGTHGKVDAATWLGLAQQGGPALSGMSDKGLITMGMVSQIMGGLRGGTALTSMYQQMVGGKMTKSAAEKLRELGVVGDFEVGKGGHVSFEKGALDTKFVRDLKEDPLEAVQTLRKAMEAQGITSIEDQVPKLFEILGRQTTQRLVHDLLRNAPQMLGERDRILGSKGIDESRNLQNNQDYKQAEHNFSAALKNFTTALGQPGVQTAVDAMNSLGRGLNYISAVATANPGATKIILEGLTGLGIAFGALAVAGVVAGAALLIPGGAVAIAVTTLVGVMGTIAAFNWSSVGGTLEKMDKSFNEIALAFGEELKALPGKLASAIAEMGAGLVSAIGDMLKNLFGKLNPFSKTAFEGSGAGGGAGGLIQNASLGGAANDNGSGSVARALAVGSGTGAGHTASKAERAAYIKARAASLGIDPNVALRVAQSEGFNTFTGDFGTSFGDFQLHYGGSGIRGMNSMGEGDLFTRATGLSAKDPKNWKAATDWALKRARQNGWGAWHGAARVGIGNRQGIGTHPITPMPKVDVPPSAPTAPPPTAGPPPRVPHIIQANHTIQLDGRTVAKSVTRHQVAEAKYPKHVGGQDTHGSWGAPGTTLTDAA